MATGQAHDLYQRYGSSPGFVRTSSETLSIFSTSTSTPTSKPNTMNSIYEEEVQTFQEETG